VRVVRARELTGTHDALGVWRDLPAGVVKKKVMGARRMAMRRRSCILLAQLRVPLTHRN
jgi:hypothetical protein